MSQLCAARSGPLGCRFHAYSASPPGLAPPILAHSSCLNRMPQTGQRTDKWDLFLTVLRPGKPRSRCQWTWCPVGAHPAQTQPAPSPSGSGPSHSWGPPMPCPDHLCIAAQRHHHVRCLHMGSSGTQRVRRQYQLPQIPSGVTSFTCCLVLPTFDFVRVPSDTSCLDRIITVNIITINSAQLIGTCDSSPPPRAPERRGHSQCTADSGDSTVLRKMEF